VSSVSNTASPVPSTTTSTGTSTSELSAELPSAADFLQILVAEFQNQDPTQPTDPTQFASQLVQFANLAQLQNIDTAVQPAPTSSLMQAASAFIGREVSSPGQAIGVQGGNATSIVYSPTSSDSYTAYILNSAGREVASVSLGRQKNGTTQTFTWKPSSSIPDGQYTVDIVNSKGAALAGLLEEGVVQSVSLASSGAIALNLGNLTLSDSQISSISKTQAK
jgi:flagellar basal-body rod modification protein FlgD